jgi:signal transduction histidine kinase
MSTVQYTGGSSAGGLSFSSKLQRVPFVGEIRDDQIVHLMGRGRIVAVDAGRILFREGDKADCACVVLSGRVHVYVSNESGQPSTVAHLDKGDFVWEMALFDGGARSATVESMEPGQVLTLDLPGFLELLAVSPSTLSGLLQCMRGNVDITNFEAELARERLRLEMETERYRSLALMVAGVAHEVNTPLGIINTASTVIRRELTSGAFAEVCTGGAAKMALEAVLEAADLVEKNIARAHKLIQNFKNISVSQISDTRDSMNLAEAVEETLYLFKLNARKARLQVEVKNDLTPEDGRWIGYRGYLSRIILNLLSNVERYAYPAGRAGRVEICLSADNKRRPASFRIDVRDFGIGIPPENLPRIFDPFFTTGRGIGGTGLGMAIVYNLVTTALQGSVVIESQPGVATTVTITVPKEVPEHPAAV